MNSPLNNWLTKNEHTIVVPRHARTELRKQIFGTPTPKRWFAPFFAVSVLGIAAALFLFVSPQKNILTPQEVLAAALASQESIPEGTIEKVTQDINLPPDFGKNVPDFVLFTDGIHFFSPNTPDQWLQRNGDHLTLTQYIKANYGIARWLMGDQTFLDETRTDIDGWQSPAAMDVCDNENCTPEQFAANLKGQVTMSQEIQEDGTRVYRIVSAGSPPDVRPLYSQTETRFITRTDIIRASDFRRLSHSWNAQMVDGTERNGEVTYTYEFIPTEELGHPFTLEWWLSTVDPKAKADVYCRAYSSSTCADATQKTEDHEPLYIPEGWLNEPALGNRKQILTGE